MGIAVRSAFGSALRELRLTHRLSQLELAGAANVSARHVAFLETGRAQPSREMVLMLVRALGASMRNCNDLLNAAGFTEQFTERAMSDTELAPLRTGLQRLLERHAPYPAVLLDRGWTLLEANAPAAALLTLWGGKAGDNMMSLLARSHASAAVVENWPALAIELAAQLRSEAMRFGDERLLVLARELEAAHPESSQRSPEPSGPVFTMRMRLPDGTRLSLFSTVGHFSTPRDLTVADLRVELFFPADRATTEYLEKSFGG